MIQHFPLKAIFRQSLSIDQRLWPNLYCACAETAIFRVYWKGSEIAIRFSDLGFLKESIWRSAEVTRCSFFIVQIENLSYYLRSIWPNHLEHISHARYTHWDTFHQVWSQSTYSFLTYNNVLLTRYVMLWPWISDPLTLNVCSAFRLSRDQTP